MSSLTDVDPQSQVEYVEAMLRDLPSYKLDNELIAEAQGYARRARMALDSSVVNNNFLALKLAALAQAYLFSGIKLELLIAQRLQAIADGDWYRTLSLTNNSASPEEIRHTYRARVRLVDPDSESGKALNNPSTNVSAYIATIKKAYESLMIPGLRAELDAKILKGQS